MQAQEKAPAFPAPTASKKRLNLFRTQMETLTPSPLGMHVIVLKVNSSLVQKNDLLFAFKSSLQRSLGESSGARGPRTPMPPLAGSGFSLSGA